MDYYSGKYYMLSKNGRFSHVMRHVVLFQYIFGNTHDTDSLFLKFLSKLVFFGVLAFTSAVFVIGVFIRGDPIGIWTQLFLYVIPLLAYPCGMYIFESKGYKQLMARDTTATFMVRFFASPENTCNEHIQPAPAHNKRWLRKLAFKSLLFPFALEIFQWLGFYAFILVDTNTNATTLIGQVDSGSINISWQLWTTMYVNYWVVNIYLLGFVSFQFVFVTRVIVKDAVSFMALFGKTRILNVFYSKKPRQNGVVRVLMALLNFLTLDLFDCMSDELVYHNSTEVRKPTVNKDNVTPETSEIEKSGEHKVDINKNLDNVVGDDLVVNKTSPSEATEIFSTFISEVEEMTSPFTLFTVILTFFGIVNLATHTMLFIRKDLKHLSYWTFFRTIIFLCVAARMLLCVQRVSQTLAKIPRHVKFLHTLGQLQFAQDTCPSWKDFFDLVDSYNLDKRSFGFPLTLREIASVATFLNMSFLIVISIFKSTNSDTPIN